jgi:hypothetical protein
MRDSRVSIDEQHVALPTLYGAPAYARPPGVAPATGRPFDPDELPLEAHQTDAEREFASALPARAHAPGGADLLAGRAGAAQTDDRQTDRSFSIRAIAGRMFRP